MKLDSPGNRVQWIQAALDRYQRSLTRYALHFTGDLERARDVVQETFLRLCRSDPARLQDRLGAWLFTVCRNQALSVCRKENRMTTLSEVGAERAPSPQPGPAEILELDDSAQRALQAVDALPKRQREVVRLKFQDGLSYRDISQVTGLSVSNVGFILHTALKSIRKQLGAESASTPKVIRRVK